MSINVKVSDRALREIYLPAFKAAVHDGEVWSLMGAYNRYKNEYCCHNDVLLNKILKQEWGFDGVVVSDWGGAHNQDESVNNGLDLEMGTSTDGMIASGTIAYSDYYLANPYLNGLKSGRYHTITLDDKVRRILRLIFRTTMSGSHSFGRFICPEHSEIARKIGEEGVVLLKNENEFLPVPVGKYKKIAVIGENATKSLVVGGGATSLKAAYEVSPLDALIDKYGAEHIEYAKGYASGISDYHREVESTENAEDLKKSAIEVARNADIVFFIGGLNKNYSQDSENSDRKNMELPFGQNELIEAISKVNKNIAVILCSGNAVSMPWLDNVQATVQNWYLGSESGNSLANILSGEVNPSGKLPFTFPAKLDDCGAHAFGSISYPGDEENVEYLEDILVGYRWFDTKDITPLYAFGHGLSYTTFKYIDISTDKTQYSKDELVKLNLYIENSGKVAGAEVVQVYISDVESTLYRPKKELKAFAKLELEPNQRKQVEFLLPVQEWAFFDDNTQKWIVEPGVFSILVGSSSADIRQQIQVEIN